MIHITLAGFHGWLKREKGLTNLQSEQLMVYYPEYVEYVRAKNGKKELYTEGSEPMRFS